MKKYGSLFIILTVIIATFSMYFIRVASAEKKMNELTFEKISGDTRYVDNVIIDGSFYDGFNYRDFSIMDGQTKIQKQNSLYYGQSFWLDELIATHKSFMRGKAFDADSYYENDEQLIYLEFLDRAQNLQAGDSLKFSIELLNKANESVQSLTVQSKLKSSLEYVSLMHMELIGNELKLVMSFHENNAEEYRLMTVDLKSKQIINDIIFESFENNEDMRTNLIFYKDHFNLASENYLIYSLDERDANLETNKVYSEQFKTLNLETNEINEFAVPINIFGDEVRMLVSDQLFNCATIMDGKVVLNRYHIEQQQWLEPVKLDAPYEILNRATFSIDFVKDKLYITAQATEGIVLYIVDASSGQLLYSGLMKLPNSQNNNLNLDHFYEK